MCTLALSVLQFCAIVVESFETDDAIEETSAVHRIDHLEVGPQITFCQVVQHSGIYEAFHERRAILRQPQTRKPHIADPLVVHVAEGQSTRQEKLF